MTYQRRRTFYRSLPQLSPAMVEALLRRAVEEDRRDMVTVLCRGVTAGRQWWVIDVWGKRRL